MTHLFISYDLGTTCSGNIISEYELEYLKSLGDVIQIGHDDINPIKYGLPINSFLQDYLVLEYLSKIDLSTIDIAHLYGGPFKHTILYLKAKGIITTNTYVSHNKDDSIREFENLGYQYPFSHIKDAFQYKMYFGARDADVLIVPSNLSKNVLLDEGCKQQIEIIPHGCIIPEKVKPMPDQFNIGYLGNIGPDKGLKYIIQSWSELAYKDSTLIFAGSYSKDLAPFINKYASSGKFHLMGYVKNISDFYNICSTYVQPSVTEGFGMEVIEAMAHGRPVIVSNGCGASDCVSDENGFIVPKRDSKIIADKIDWLKNHPYELLKMGENAREKSKQFSWDKIKERYINLWKSLKYNHNKSKKLGM